MEERVERIEKQWAAKMKEEKKNAALQLRVLQNTYVRGVADSHVHIACVGG